VVEEGFAEIPTWHPAVGKVIPVAIRRWRKNLWETLKSGEWRALQASPACRKIRPGDRRPGLLKSAWLTRYVKAPVAGLDKHSAREPLASRFYQRRLAVARGQHAVERLRQLFAVALGYDLPKGLGDYGLDVERLVELPRKSLLCVLARHHVGHQTLARSVLARFGRAHGPFGPRSALAVGQPG
jgi:heptosyltransferase I